MELVLDEEQEMLRDSAAAFASRHANRLRRPADGKIDRDVWSKAAAAGWLAALAPDAAGGLGLGLTELCLVSQQLGRKLVPEPIAAAAAAARALAHGDRETASAVIAGRMVVLPALAEGPRAIGDEPPAAAAKMRKGAVLLNGAKTGVAGPADGYLVSAAAADGIVLVHAPPGDARWSRAADGTATGTVSFAGVEARLAAGPNEAAASLASLLDALHLATAAELLGVTETAQEMTIEYLKTREQFGRPIGSFQALQHRAVDNHAAIEMCRSLVYQAARAMDSGGGAPALPPAALAYAADAALAVCKSAIQMHGGIGFTDEHDIGLCLKRAMTLSARYGNAGMHRRRYAALAESSGPAAGATP